MGKTVSRSTRTARDTRKASNPRAGAAESKQPLSAPAMRALSLLRAHTVRTPVEFAWRMWPDSSQKQNRRFMSMAGAAYLRRLEQRGLICRGPREFRVIGRYRLTDAGRAALKRGAATAGPQYDHKDR